MSEDRTKDLNQTRSNDDERFERMEIRITKLEDREYDTKPIWERALAEIAELSSKFDTEMEGLRTDLRSEFQTGIEGLRTEMKAEFASVRTEMRAEFASVRHNMEHELRRFGRKMDVLNETFSTSTG